MFQQEADKPCGCGGQAKWVLLPSKYLCDECKEKEKMIEETQDAAFQNISQYMLEKLQRKDCDLEGMC